MLARKINPFSKYVCSIGKLAGGTTQNVTADYVEMLGTIRTFDMELDKFIIDRISRMFSIIFSNPDSKEYIDSFDNMICNAENFLIKF